MAEDDRLALADGKDRHGCSHAVAHVPGLQPPVGCRPGIDQGLQVLRPARTDPAQPVPAEVEGHPVEPGVEAGFPEAPDRCLPPGPDQGFLGDVLGLGGVSQNTGRKGGEARKLAGGQGPDSQRVSGSDPADEVSVRVVDAGWCRRSVGMDAPEGVSCRSQHVVSAAWRPPLSCPGLRRGWNLPRRNGACWTSPFPTGTWIRLH